jgi:citrate lyase subunit beta/citryl-CoA lyase
MRLRSMLFVPADSERKLAKAVDSGADALILDLEDAVAPAEKPAARGGAARFISSTPRARAWKTFVRINPLDTGLALADLAAVVAPGLDGIVLPKANSAADVARLAHYLDAFEEKAGVAHGHVRIVVVATETAEAVFSLGSYRPGMPRLEALTWGAEDLSAAVGASSNREDSGELSGLYLIAGSLCLCAAAAAGASPIDTLFADFKDEAGLSNACRSARRRGFVGKIAIHPAQVSTINASFTPSEAEIAAARRIVEAFEAQPRAGAVSIDGVMYDMPHLKQARRTLDVSP